MTASVDDCHFRDLAEMDPEDVCRRALCRYNADERCYVVSVWDEAYAVYPGESRILRLKDNHRKIKTYLGLFMVHYLLTAKDVPIQKEWISAKDMPGGTTFFRGPHAIPVHLIRKRYEKDLRGFCDACERLGGTPLHMADKAYTFRIAPRIPVALLLWRGDDEFPAESRMLFDRSIMAHLALDIVFSLAVFVCTTIADFSKNGP